MITDYVYYESVDQLKLLMNLLAIKYTKRDCTLNSYLAEESEMDLALFCLNRIKNDVLIEYLARKKRVVGSYFLNPKLEKDEYTFPELAVAKMGIFIPFDSRLLIKAKLEYLYFFMPILNVNWYHQEYIMGETYLING